MQNRMYAQDPIVFMQKRLENAYAEGDLDTAWEMSRRIDGWMVQMNTMEQEQSV